MAINKAKTMDLSLPKTSIPPGTFLEDLLTYAEGVTDTPDEFLITSGLIICSSVLGKNVWMNVGLQKLRPHLWAIILGKSSVLRKSTNISLAKRLLSEVDPALVFSNEITPETFIECLSENPHGLFHFGEIGGFMKNCEKTYMAGFKQLLTDLYDCPEVYKRTRKNKKGEPVDFIINEPTINILGASTFDWFIGATKDDDLYSGFLPRFLFCSKQVRTKQKLVFPQNPDKELSGKLNKQLHSLRQNWKGEKNLSKEASEKYSYWSQQIDQELQSQEMDKLSLFYTRLEVMALKMAIIIQGLFAAANDHSSDTFENTNEIGSEAMNYALLLANFYKENVRNLVFDDFTFSHGAKQKKKVLDLLKMAGGSCTKRILLQKGGFLERELSELLHTLQEEDQVKIKGEKQQSGQSKKMVYLLNE